MYTGPMIDRKDQESAIKGVISSKYRDKLYLVLCGDGQNLEKLKDKYKSNKNIIFKGKINNISEILRACDIYISTSKSEGMPNSVLEAMATGLPVILSNIPQHMELFDISKDIGKNYELNNINDLTEKIDELIESNYNEIGKYNNIITNRYLTANVMSYNYQKLYEKMINSN